jgi:hypothetical protein
MRWTLPLRVVLMRYGSDDVLCGQLGVQENIDAIEIPHGCAADYLHY